MPRRRLEEGVRMSQNAGKDYWEETDKRRKRGCLRVLVFCLVLAVILTVAVSI